MRWASGMEGGFVRGREDVRAYWLRQFQTLRPHLEVRIFKRMKQAARCSRFTKPFAIWTPTADRRHCSIVGANWDSCCSRSCIEPNTTRHSHASHASHAFYNRPFRAQIRLQPRFSAGAVQLFKTRKIQSRSRPGFGRSNTSTGD